MNRRKFFGAVGSILAAPAIVRAESLMKLWAPDQKLLVGGVGTIEIFTFYETKFMTPQIWAKEIVKYEKQRQEFLKHWKRMK